MAMKVKQERELIEGVEYRLEFKWLDAQGRDHDVCDYGGFSFECDKDGNLTDDYTKPEKACALENYNLCRAGTMESRDGTLKIGPGKVVAYPFSHWTERIVECEKCGGDAFMQRGCGAYVCTDCEHHQGLCRCYCGWSESGGDGHAELVEMGETIDPDY